jgi:hypothetical protein
LMISRQVCVVGALRLISTASTANSSTWMVAPAAAAAAEACQTAVLACRRASAKCSQKVAVAAVAPTPFASVVLCEKQAAPLTVLEWLSEVLWHVAGQSRERD